MKVRLLHDDVVSLEAITPDRVTIRIEDCAVFDADGTWCDLVLDEEQIDRLWRFMLLLTQWQTRLAVGAGPPAGFDRDITTPEGA